MEGSGCDLIQSYYPEIHSATTLGTNIQSTNHVVS